MLSKKALSLKPSPTLAIAAKAKELAAQGHSVISLSVGEPDWDTFAAIKDAGCQAIQAGQTKYGPSNGSPQLRTAVAHRTKELLGVDYTPNEVTVSAGAKFILYAALQMLVDPGDEVLIPAPYWVSYPTMVELVDGVPVIVQSDELSGFKAQGVHLEKKVTPKTKVLLLNSPNNPTGQMYTRAEIEGIVSFLRRHPQIVVISDDIYNQLVFEGEKVAPHILHVAPDLKDRVLVVNGASKTYSMTGWRIAWALGNESLIKAMSNYQSQTVSCASPFTQTAALTGLQACDAEVLRGVELLRERRNLFVEALNNVPGWRSGLPQGAFYVWADIRELLGRRWHGRELKTSNDFASALLESQYVAVVPGAESGLDGYLRLSFAVHERDLNEAVKRIRLFTDSLD
ncbi:MAG: pyridoxal phosphate-dependent aminotransferase [Bdellovibrionales bacterium]|nr:pyridoxal phosphate-dependent aminotransferase [Bdellovibrionales bacterium]